MNFFTDKTTSADIEELKEKCFSMNSCKQSEKHECMKETKCSD